MSTRSKQPSTRKPSRTKQNQVHSKAVTKSVPTPPNPWDQRFTIIVLVMTFALLFVTQYVFSVAYWFNWSLTSFSSLAPLACVWPDFCNALRFPAFGFIALLTALLAAILFGFWSARQKLSDFLTEPKFSVVQFPNLGGLNIKFDGTLIVVFGLCQTYIIVMAIQDQPVLPLVWVVGLLALFLIGWRLDRSRSGTPSWQLLSPSMLNGLYVGGIATMLLTVAALYSQSWLWVVVFGTTTALVWWRVFLSNWKDWDRPSRLERITIPLITLGSFLLFSYKLDSWEWSFIGDEYSFFGLGQSFANGTMVLPILSGAGIDGKHPVLSSVWQGVTMWLFGADSYGWRVSNSLLLALSIPFFYYFLRPIIGRTGALFAVVLYGSAHVLFSLGHYGCNNAQIIIVMATSLAAFIWAGHRGRWAGFVLVGLCLGLGFYTLAVARIYPLVIAIWLAIYYFPFNFQGRRVVWQNVGVWFTVVGTALLTALPVLSTRSAWLQLGQQTVFTSEVSFTRQEQFIQSLKNTLYGLTSFLFNNQNGHWVFGANADPITSTLMVIGVAMLLVPSKQTLKVRISLVGSFFIFVIIVAGLQQYDYPTITRIFALVPFYAIFATIGLLAIVRAIPVATASRTSGTILTNSAIIITALIVPLNIWQSNVLSQQHSEQYSQAFLLQGAEMSADKTGAGPHLFIVDDPQDKYLVQEVFAAFKVPTDRYTFVLSDTILLPDNVICKSANQPTIVMVTTTSDKAGYIVSKLRECWPNSELRLIKDNLGNARQYRLINKSALPFTHLTSGYWQEENMLETILKQSSDDNRADWIVYQPTGISQNSKGQLAIVEKESNQLVFLNSTGHIQSKLENIFVDPADVAFLPDGSFVVADAGKGLLWFDSAGRFLFFSDAGAAPRGLTVAPDGTIYVAVTGNQNIIQVKTDGERLRTISGPQFQQPTSVAVAPDGRIAVGDPAVGKITVNSSTGELLSEYPITLGGDTTLAKPGLLWLQDGSLIYTDPVGNRMAWVDKDGNLIKEWSDLKFPTDLVLQSADKLLVLESRDNHILSIQFR